jgi:MoxR-like ATPase
MADRQPDAADAAGAPDLGVAAIARIRDGKEKILREVRKVIIGQDRIVDDVITAFFAGGHCLITGVPGLAKTLLISSLGRAMDLQFRRIQFTPDLMPADITGSEVLEEDTATRQRELKFHPGPIFTNILLADEINRTPPKTQSALLEAMQEHQVTVSGSTYTLR